MDKRLDAIEIVVDVFNEAMAIQDLYLRKSKFKELSMSETHVIDAVNKLEIPSMTNVANKLNITTGTLTTAVKRIIEKGFEALKIHDQFHKELADLYQSAIPEEHVEWLLQTLGQIKINLDNYRQELEDK